MNRIRELRKEMHITQVQLSIELGVTQETISAYEHGRHYPSVEALIKLSDIFHASMDYIMGLSDIRTIMIEPLLSPEEQEQRSQLLHYYKILNKPNRQCLLSYAQGLHDASRKK